MSATGPITAKADWRQILAEPDERAHTVQLYTETGFLTRAVAHYAGTGLRRGEAVIVIATPQHFGAFLQRLQDEGLDVARLLRKGQLIVMGAAETLDRFMGGGRPDGARFAHVMGKMLDRVAARYPRVRAYGEMVNLLWERGELEPALELEGLWNELRTTRAFSLHCAYAMDSFDPSAHCCALEGVHHAHSHLIPVEDYRRLNEAVGRALSEVLGPAGALTLQPVLAARQRSGAQMPEAQATLMGLAQVHPGACDAVLTRARQYYGAAPEATVA